MVLPPGALADAGDRGAPRETGAGGAPLRRSTSWTTRLVSGGSSGRPAPTSSSRGRGRPGRPPGACHERPAAGPSPRRRWPGSLAGGHLRHRHPRRALLRHRPDRPRRRPWRPYRELPVRALLHLPQPSPAYGWVLLFVILVSAVVAASGRLPRLAGWVCAGHARLGEQRDVLRQGRPRPLFALVVALLVLPTVGRAVVRGPAHRAAGWALRMIHRCRRHLLPVRDRQDPRGRLALGQLGDAHLGAEPPRRRPAGTVAVDAAGADVRHAVDGLCRGVCCHPSCCGCGPGAARRGGLRIVFHACTYVLLTIHFLPTAICLLAFLPLERIGRRRLRVHSGDGRRGGR